ncbi:MAG: 2-oxoacid:acceptor oxidoreductase [Planctomycetota bacterium]|nr:MAG: 2-oxoacid:acceptor oxidoreductase [Planctomycetota bacterium]
MPETKKPYIEIVTDRCKGCELCISACPKDCIELDTSVVNAKGVNPAKYVGGCIGCGSCMLICPDVCIELYKEEKIQKSA